MCVSVCYCYVHVGIWRAMEGGRKVFRKTSIPKYWGVASMKRVKGKTEKENERK